MRQNCPKWKGNKKKNYKIAGTAGVVTKGSDEDGDDILAKMEVPKPDEIVSAKELTTTSNNSRTSCILDSRCSYHMCPNRELFATYQITKWR